MAKQKKQVIDTGNGLIKKPILASGKENTAEGLKQSQKSTSIGGGNTKPLSIREALSLLQTLCLDLRGLKCEVAILAKTNRLYIIVSTPASIGELGTKNGHITINELPVSEKMFL